MSDISQAELDAMAKIEGIEARIRDSVDADELAALEPELAKAQAELDAILAGSVPEPEPEEEPEEIEPPEQVPEPVPEEPGEDENGEPEPQRKYVPIDHFQTRDIQASESASLGTRTTEWSYGDKETGYIGIPIGANTYLLAWYFNADEWSQGAATQITLRDFRTASTTAEILATFDCRDLQENNAYTYVKLDEPAKLPDGAVIGFRTEFKDGTVKDARVGVVIGEKIGQVLSVISV